MNSQIVLVNAALRSKLTLLLVTCCIPVSLFLKAGFVSVAVIWFFALSMYNLQPSSDLPIKVKKNFVLVLPALIFLFYVIALFFTSDPVTSLELVARRIHLLLIPAGFIVIHQKMDRKDLDIILSIFFVCCMLASLVCLSQAIANSIRFQSLDDQSGGYQSYFMYAKLTEGIDIPPVYMSLFCNLAFVVITQTSMIENRTLKAGLGLYIVIFILLLSSVVGMVCLCISLVLWLLVVARKKKIIAIFLAGSVALGALVFFVKLPEIRSRLAPVMKGYKSEKGGLLNNMPSRFIIWGAAVETIKQKPLGYGPGDGQRALEETYRKIGFEWGLNESLNPHNEFLSTTLDVGVTGLVVLVLLFLLPLIKAIRTRDLLVLNFLILMIFFFFAESVLVRQKGIVFFAFFYSLLFMFLPGAKTSNGIKPQPVSSTVG